MDEPKQRNTTKIGIGIVLATILLGGIILSLVITDNFPSVGGVINKVQSLVNRTDSIGTPVVETGSQTSAVATTAAIEASGQSSPTPNPESTVVSNGDEEPIHPGNSQATPPAHSNAGGNADDKKDKTVPLANPFGL